MVSESPTSSHHHSYGRSLLSSARGLLLPTRYSGGVWPRWARPRRAGIWFLYTLVALMWVLPPSLLLLGEWGVLPAAWAEALVMIVPSFLVLVISAGFVISWWPRLAAREVLTDILVTPSSPYEHVRSVLRPLQALLIAGCVPLVALTPGSDLLAWVTGKGFLRGEWGDLGMAINCLMCAVLDAPAVVWLCTRFRDSIRTLLVIPVTILLWHFPLILYLEGSIQWGIDTEIRSLILGCGLLLQLAIAVGLAIQLPVSVNRWARETVERPR